MNTTTFAPPAFISPQRSPGTVSDALLPQWLYRTRWHGVLVAMALSLIVGLVDIATVREFQVVPLYLLPVALATWVVGRNIGMGIAAFCALLWLGGDLLESSNYLHPLAPYWNAAGLLLTFTAVSWIVTRLHVAVHSLEDTVQDRTAALLSEMGHRQRAEEARLHAERLAIVGTMSAQLAHEVRNPLGSITLNIDLLSDEISTLAKTSTHPPEESRELLSQFRQELRHLKQIVDGYMSLVRRPRFDFRPLEVNHFLAKKLRIVQTYLTASQIKLVQDFDAKIESVELDGDKLWEALMNLLTNARQAMPDGGRITLRTVLAGGELHVIVSDTGIGITPAQMQHLYEPFFTTKPEGTGLGLVLVQQIIAEMGGRLTCQSEPGIGTTFTIALPRQVPRISATATPKPRIP